MLKIFVWIVGLFSILILILILTLFYLLKSGHNSVISPLLKSQNIYNLFFPTDESKGVFPPKILTPTPSLSVTMTFYGYVDNDPPGKAIAFPHSRYPSTLHEEAGGVGSFADPVTIAVKKDRFLVGTKMYIPKLKKYGLVEDICANCKADQIDVWMESSAQFKKELLACERKWTEAVVGIELNPADSWPVNLQPFFDYSKGLCNKT